jgi:hypothetical protein
MEDWAHKRVEPVDQYLRSFQWNKVKYRADKPIAELVDTLQKVGGVTRFPHPGANISRKYKASTTTSRPSSPSTIKPRAPSKPLSENEPATSRPSPSLPS